jgi:hypothetical protein
MPLERPTTDSVMDGQDPALICDEYILSPKDGNRCGFGSAYHLILLYDENFAGT